MNEHPSQTWALYERAADLVEAQVDRQWSTTQFFVLLNASVLAGAITLLQFASTPLVGALLLGVLLGGVGLAVAGLRVLRVNKTYYRALVAKKTILEAHLGLAGAVPGFEQAQHGTFSLGPVATQRKVAEILADPDGYVNARLRRWSATDWARWVLLGFAAFDGVAALLVLETLTGCRVPGVACGALA